MLRLRSISALVFSLLVLVSSSSFYVGMHLCGGKIRAVALSAMAEGCQHQKAVPPCHKKETSKGCCEDKVLVHEALSYKNEAVHIISDASAYQQVVPFMLVAEVIPSPAAKSSSYFHYDTPLVPVDRTVIHQVFLI